MTWRGLSGNAASQFRSGREATIEKMGTGCTIYIASRARQAGQGFRAKSRRTLGPLQVYVYWESNMKAGRGQQGDENTRQDRDGTWTASFLLADGDAIWPTGQADADSLYELVHPVYGRMRIDRVQQMSVQGQSVGYQVGLTRVS